MAPERDHIVYSRDVRATGESPSRLERAVARGELIRIRRGAYIASALWRDLQPAARHRLLVEATRASAKDEPVFSHESAAAVHRIPLVGTWPSRVHVTVRDGRQSSNSAVMRVRRDVPIRSVLTMPDGTLVTSPLATALDLAASRSLLTGIVAVSHVRRTLGLSVESLRDALHESGIHKGIVRARLAIERSAAASDSALETLVVVRCQDLGFEPPSQQFLVAGTDGRSYRVDFAWRAGRILGESDGRGKYRDPELLDGRTPEEVVWAEKLRENAIRPSCEQLLRLTWSDAWNGAGLAAALIAAGVDRPRQPRPLTR